jgi:glutamyl-tRNA synthetase
VPEALMNYLALLGWSFDDETTFFSRDELVERFELSRVSRNPAAFDAQKLEWMNGHYIRALDDDELAARTIHFFNEEGLLPDPEVLRRAMPFVKERIATLVDAVALLRFVFSDDVEPDEKARRVLEGAGPQHLLAAADALSEVQEWTQPAVEAALTRFQQASGLSKTKAWQPLRAALTGSTVSPPIEATALLIGRERSIDRLRAAADRLRSESPAS